MMRSSFCVLACLIVGRVASHPLCFIDDKPTDFDQELTFCPEAQDGACCTDIEEDNVSAAVDAVGELTTECRELYKKVVCGVCHSYSAHLYERLGAELGALDGMTMKQDFCDELVDACADQIPGIARTYPGGLSYCEKHVGSTGDQFWSFPYEEPEIFEPGLTFVFPDLDNDEDFPRNTISMRQTPDGESFWLMGQQGEVKIVQADELGEISQVVDISNNGVFYVAFEEGLLDIAFDPNWGVSGFPDIFYLSYTCQLNDGENPRNRISKFEYFPGDPSATLDSEEVLLTTAPKFNSIHSAGWCGFKHSDYGDGSSSHDLYWTTGDGGPQTDTFNAGQDTTNMLGSMMRITVPSDGTGYTIPSGNLGSLPDVLPEICASGLRNPFRCSFDRATDVLYCGDVGHTNVEEIDIIECGNNYGWSRFEGSRCQEAQEDRDGDCQGASRSGFTFPWFEYCHPDYFSEGDEDQFTGNQNICGDRFITGHAVIGGYVYRGNYFSDLLTGAYIFGDATNRNIYYLVEVDGELVLGTIVSDSSVAIISFSEDINGELIMITRNFQIYHMPCGDLCASTCLPQSEDNVVVADQGCFNDDSGDRVLSLAESDCGEGERAMNAQICASYCDTLGAKYAGVQFSFECFCGNDEDFDRLGALPASSCEMLCTANPDEFCGGNSAIQVYEISSTTRPPVTPAPFVMTGDTPAPTLAEAETPAPVVVGPGTTPAPMDPSITPAPVDPGTTPAPMEVVSGPGTLIGCFTDTNAARIMTKTATQSPMGSEVCQAICSDSLFYGTQFSNECWCGGQRTDYDVHGPSTGCTSPCAGNTGEICGGSFAMTVYENNGDAGEPVTPSPVVDATPAPVAVPTLAPVVDSTPAPVAVPTPAPVVGSTPAPIAVAVPTPAPVSVLTPAPVAVVDEPTPSPIRILTSSNSMETPAPVDVASPADEDSFLGCFADLKESRIMANGPNSATPMSAEICADFCGTVIYGTQFGQECWCGDENTDYDANGLATCDFACSGNAGEICGGRNAMSVYSGGSGTAPNPQPPTPDAPTATFIGCFADVMSDRIMMDQISSALMTTEACAVLCDGNPFFGTQYGLECWCGADSDYDRHGPAVCDFDCTGDSSETCGGRNAMSVYSS